MNEKKIIVVIVGNYTCAGICAHESAMNNGKRISIPDFEL